MKYLYLIILLIPVFAFADDFIATITWSTERASTIPGDPPVPIPATEMDIAEIYVNDVLVGNITQPATTLRFAVNQPGESLVHMIQQDVWGLRSDPSPKLAVTVLLGNPINGVLTVTPAP